MCSVQPCFLKNIFGVHFGSINFPQVWTQSETSGAHERTISMHELCRNCPHQKAKKTKAKRSQKPPKDTNKNKTTKDTKQQPKKPNKKQKYNKKHNQKKPKTVPPPPKKKKKNNTHRPGRIHSFAAQHNSYRRSSPPSSRVAPTLRVHGSWFEMFLSWAWSRKGDWKTSGKTMENPKKHGRTWEIWWRTMEIMLKNRTLEDFAQQLDPTWVFEPSGRVADCVVFFGFVVFGLFVGVLSWNTFLGLSKPEPSLGTVLLQIVYDRL